ncbi:MAG: Ig-like domain-containing protein, partial [Thermoanaerobaculia bacterium]
DGNLVFGIERASGEEEGWHTGIVATQTGVSFPPHIEYTGRFFRSSDDARVGFTFFSAQPDAEHYYLAGTTSHGELALTSAGAATPVGVATSPFVASPGVWYRFRIEAEDASGATTIRARVWKDGDAEPTDWNINAVDSDASRPRGGHVGIWSAGRGAFYVDDLVAIAPASTTSDTTPPVIAFFADGKPLDPAKRAVFGSDVAIEIRAVDQSNVTLSATIDSAQYASLQLVTSEGPHVIRAHAVDEAGNAADAQLSLVLDKTPPVVTLLERGAPFTATLFNRDVEPSVSVQDLTTTKVTATLDGSAFAFGPSISAEGDHALALHVEDEAGHAVDVGPVRFTIDKTPPHISFTSPSAQQLLANAHPSATGNADDAVSVVVNGVTAAIDAAKKFTAVVDLLEGSNTITAVATDRAGNQASVSVPVTVDTRAPELTIDALAAPSVDATSLVVRGHVSDPALRSVKLTTGAVTVDATIAADRRTWSATIPLPPVAMILREGQTPSGKD